MSSNNSQASDIIETNSGDARDEYKLLVTPNFTSLVYELESLLQNGWAISSEHPPVDNVLLYEVHLEKNARTLARMKERYEAALEGRPVWGTAERKDNMAKARETRMKKIAEKKAVEGGDEG